MLAENSAPSALTMSFNWKRPRQKRSLIPATRSFKHRQGGVDAPSGPPLALTPAQLSEAPAEDPDEMERPRAVQRGRRPSRVC